MGHIVSNGRKHRLTQPKFYTERKLIDQKRLLTGVRFDLDVNKHGGKEKRKHFSIFRSGKTGAQVLEDMTVVREYLGVTASGALSISLHAFANAIRANKAHPEVPNGH